MRRRPTAGAPRAAQRGQATVEFSFCVIILLSVVLGLFDIGRAVLAQWAISEMAWAGGRYASRGLTTDTAGTPLGTISTSFSALSSGTQSTDLPGSSSHATAITAAARAAAFLIDPFAPQIVVEFPDGEPQAGRRVRIAITYGYQPVSSQFIGGRTIQLSSANTLLILR